MNTQVDSEEPVETSPEDNASKGRESGSLHSLSHSVFQSETLPETSDTKQFSSPGQDDATRLERLQQLVKILKDQSRGLDNLSLKNLEPVFAEFQKSFDETLDIAQKHAKSYISEASAIEEALTALAEYNQKGLTSLNKLIVDAVNAIGEPHVSISQDQVKASEALIEQTKQLVRTAERQVAYSKEMGNIAKPLTSWRLDAFRWLWQAKNAQKQAENHSTELKEKAIHQPTEAGSNQHVIGSNTSDQRDTTESQPDELKPVPPKASRSRT